MATQIHHYIPGDAFICLMKELPSLSGIFSILSEESISHLLWKNCPVIQVNHDSSYHNVLSFGTDKSFKTAMNIELSLLRVVDLYSYDECREYRWENMSVTSKLKEKY